MARERIPRQSANRIAKSRAPKASSGQGARTEDYVTAILHSADVWLTPRSVAGFDPADFTDWPEKDRDELAGEVRARSSPLRSRCHRRNPQPRPRVSKAASILNESSAASVVMSSKSGLKLSKRC